MVSKTLVTFSSSNKATIMSAPAPSMASLPAVDEEQPTYASPSSIQTKKQKSVSLPSAKWKILLAFFAVVLLLVGAAFGIGFVVGEKKKTAASSASASSDSLKDTTSSSVPSAVPSSAPFNPTVAPTWRSSMPTGAPVFPTKGPTSSPSDRSSMAPTQSPQPSTIPTTSSRPSAQPSRMEWEPQWNNQSVLIGSMNAEQMGRFFAFSGDGNVIVSSSYYQDVVRTFVRNETNNNKNLEDEWEVGAPVIPESARSLAINEDGTVMALGFPSLYQVQIYVRGESDDDWTLEGTLYGEPETRFGDSLALSSQGNVIVVGAPQANDYDNNQFSVGYVRVYRRVRISQQNNILTWTIWGQSMYGENHGDWFGYSVDISSDGSTIVAGAKSRYFVKLVVFENGVWKDVEGATEVLEKNYYLDSYPVSISGDASTVAIAGRVYTNRFKNNQDKNNNNDGEEEFFGWQELEFGYGVTGSVADLSADGNRAVFVRSSNVQVYQLTYICGPNSSLNPWLCYRFQQAVGSSITGSFAGGCCSTWPKINEQGTILVLGDEEYCTASPEFCASGDVNGERGRILVYNLEREDELL